MIVFAALTPHTPLLLPTIGKEHEKKLEKTLAAFQELKKNLHASAPDVIIVISPHSEALSDAVVINLAETYKGDLSEFGDLETKPQFRSDHALIDQLQRNLRKENQKITLTSSEAIDYGAVVPLILLEMNDATKLIHLIPSSKLDFKSHFALGEKMKDVLASSTKRVAIIVSNNLSHRLSSESPAGFSPKGKAFDTAIRESLETSNTKRLITLSVKLVEEAGQCGFRGLLILLGILSNIHHKTRILAYEHPFGVGYLTAHFMIQ